MDVPGAVIRVEQATTVFISRFYEDSIGGVFATREFAQCDCNTRNATGKTSGWEVEEWEVQGVTAETVR